MSIIFSDITIETFVKLLKESNSPSLICGNGLSINFEPSLSLKRLGEAMYSTHTYIMTFSSYKTVSPQMEQVFLPNYKAAIKHMKKTIHSEDDFTVLFSDAVEFAKFINNPQISEWIKTNGFSKNLVMGFGPLDYVADLVKQSEQSDSIFCINYELWTILIYFALIILDAPSSLSANLDSNKFVQAVRIGGQRTLGLTNKSQNDYYSKTCENGMFIYYRLLLSSNILLTGNGYNVDLMSKWSNYQKDVLAGFLNLFNYIMTTNYDLLLERLTGRPIYHLHGCYTRSPQTVLGQSLGIFVNSTRYDLSSILIGDYFIAKTFYAITAHMSQKFPTNTKVDFHHEIMEQIIANNKSDTIVIFGLNVNNDFHIIRNIQVFLEKSKLKQAKVIFCYFNAEDKISFEHAYESCITYLDELNKYVQENISVYTIDSHYILQHFFVDNEQGKVSSHS